MLLAKVEYIQAEAPVNGNASQKCSKSRCSLPPIGPLVRSQRMPPFHSKSSPCLNGAHEMDHWETTHDSSPHQHLVIRSRPKATPLWIRTSRLQSIVKGNTGRALDVGDRRRGLGVDHVEDLCAQAWVCVSKLVPRAAVVHDHLEVVGNDLDDGLLQWRTRMLAKHDVAVPFEVNEELLAGEVFKTFVQLFGCLDAEWRHLEVVSDQECRDGVTLLAFVQLPNVEIFQHPVDMLLEELTARKVDSFGLGFLRGPSSVRSFLNPSVRSAALTMKLPSSAFSKYLDCWQMTQR